VEEHALVRCDHLDLTKRMMSCSQRDVALKQLHIGAPFLMDEVVKEFCIEVKLMSALKHENVVEFLGITCSEKNELYLVMVRRVSE